MLGTLFYEIIRGFTDLGVYSVYYFYQNTDLSKINQMDREFTTRYYIVFLFSSTEALTSRSEL